MRPRNLLIWILALAVGVGDAAAQSPAGQGEMTACEAELAELDAEADDLADKLAACQADVANRDGKLEQTGALFRVDRAALSECQEGRAELRAEVARAPDPVVVAGIAAALGAIAGGILVAVLGR